MSDRKPLRIALLSLHGLIRGTRLELGRDEDTGGQIRYVLDLARALSAREEVGRVDLITRQILDERVSPDYAVLEEQIAEKGFIVRIPFGPRRYLGKTKLWPYMEMFVDQCLNYFQRTDSVPDILHGHYADAGYGGGQLARLLGVPFVFTGHSLGRVKRERSLASGVAAEKIEARYQISTRIEAEEFALETCSLICASTRQEVKEQYEIYEHYAPERMVVIPPGVDLTAFHPPREEDAEPRVAGLIARFLDEPAKPMLLAMARPDERKNLEMLVQVYGESTQLRRLANLVLIMGSREDIRLMPSGQREVLQNVLAMIDAYDLYGQVAYPQTHPSEEVPAIYRLATRSRGLFVNAAMTEPFGLTLLEAAASGLPVVATHDGGPRDILANCQNGLLVDPFDPEAIEHALLRGLQEPDAWENWSHSGVENVHAHYAWDRHAGKYLRDVGEILEGFHEPPLVISGRRTRRMVQIDRLVIADIDNTLTGDDAAMARFFDFLANTREHIGFGIATGRRHEEVLKLMHSHGMPHPEVLIASVGTEIYYGKNLDRDKSWQRHIDFRWDPDRVREVLCGLDGFFLQDPAQQSTYKISFEVDFSRAPSLAQIKRILRENQIRAKVISSLGMFLDVIPFRAGSGLSIRHMAYKWGIPLEKILIAGDSGNDEEMLSGNTLGVVVGNYSPELEKLRRYPRVYFAKACHAAGIMEGIDYYHFLDHIEIPNDRTEEDG